MQYDAGRVIIYPDETIIDDYQPEGPDGEPLPARRAYQYEGTERDGGYIVECKDITNVHEVANAIIRTHYTASEEFALQRHHQNEPEAYEEQWKDYCEWADKASDKAKLWLNSNR